MQERPFPIDDRGYMGAEKNRQLTPEQVVWARENYFHRKVDVRTLGKMFEMSVESVRRMLRGDTYRNVAKALPRAKDAQAEMNFEQQAEESARRMAELAKASEPDLAGLAEGQEEAKRKLMEKYFPQSEATATAKPADEPPSDADQAGSVFD